MAAEPVQDWLFSITQVPGSNKLVVDVASTPGGDFSTVAGIGRAEQNIKFFLLNATGADYWNPGYGNPFLPLLGRPNSPELMDNLQGMMETALQWFLDNQDAEAANGWLDTDAQIDHFDNVVTGIGYPGEMNPTPSVASVSFTIVSRAGNRLQTFQPFTFQVS